MVILNSDLSATIARIRALTSDLELSADIGPLNEGQYTARDFVNPALPLIQDTLVRHTLRHPSIDKRTSGAFLLGNYAWYIPVPAVAMYLIDRRVPHFSLDTIGLRHEVFRWEEHGESGENERVNVHFLSNRFFALPDDPAAGQPEVTIVPDMPALRDVLRTSIEAFLIPLVEELYVQTNLSRYAQWNIIADLCASMFLYIGQLMGDEQRGMAEGLAFLKATDSPLNNPRTGYVSLQYESRCETFRTRGGCCRYYKLPNHDKCSACVLRTVQDRDEQLIAYMKKKYTKETSQ